MSMEELQGYLQARADDHTQGLAHTFETEEDLHAGIIKLVNEEAATFDEVGAWYCYCSCGWRGNNPYPGQDGALQGVEEHRGHYEREAREAAERQADG